MSSKPRTQLQEWFAGCDSTSNRGMLSAQEPVKLQGLPWDLREAPYCDSNQGQQAQSFYGSKSFGEKF